ncbi:MAG: mechanosensitive ion channel, partial [Saprospiraceae bacterium]|nr:mechanosensitive ion channel [Saprospiraceae bacterium]
LVLLDHLLDLFLFVLTAHLIVVLLSWIYRRQKDLKRGQNDNVLIGLKNIYYLLVTGAVILTILGFFGIDYQTLFTSLSIVAAAIAIISRDFIVEIVSGIIISFSRDFNIGDYVKIGEHKGKITDINITKIALLNEDDDLLMIPNQKVFSGEIINYTRKPIKKVNIEFELQIQAIRTIEELESDLAQVLSEYGTHVEEDSINLKIVEIRKDSLLLKFQYVLDRIERELEREIRRKTIRRVVNYLKENYELTRPAAK